MHAARPSSLVFSAFALAILALAAAPSAHAQSGPTQAPKYDPSDPDAAPVTASNLMENDRFWPYFAGVAEAWPIEGRDKPLSSGTHGVLVRVEPSGIARIDFGRDGVHEIPIEKTDVVERANRVRRGLERKLAPNFVHSVGPRLITARGESPNALDFAEAFEAEGFVSVFADPRDENFVEIGRALAPLHGRHGVWTVLFPHGHQGEIPTTQVFQQLRKAGWEAAFLHDAYSEGYTRSQRGFEAPVPAVMLHTRDGKVLYRGLWSEKTLEELETALEASFGASGEAVAGQGDGAQG